VTQGWSWEKNGFTVIFIGACGGLIVLTLLAWLLMGCCGKLATGPPVPHDGLQVNYELTMRTLICRRLERTHYGTKEPKRLLLTFVLVIFLATVFGLVTFADKTITFNIGINNPLISLLVFLVVLWISFFVINLIRWVLYWLILGAILLLFVDGHPSIHFSQEQSATFRNAVCCAIIFLICVTICIWVIERKLYPLSIKNDFSFFQPLAYRLLIETTTLPPLPPTVAQSAGYTTKERGRIRFYYRQPGGWPWRWFGTTAKRVASYDGYIDSAGRPHGYGVWQDSAPRGENLHGIWRHGLPCGPFQSSEAETGHGFTKIHIAFVTARAEQWHVKHWKPQRSDAGLHWGIAAVEACYAGGFFKHLPCSELFVAPTAEPDGGSALSCVKRLAQVPMLGSEESVAKVGDPFEAVLYIHGFASSLYESSLPFGQLLALADLPTRVKPFIFSWPCGHYLTYFSAKAMAKSPQCAKDLAAVMRSLHEAGATAIHVIAYSLGAQLLVSALDEIAPLFAPAADAPTRPGDAPPSTGCCGASTKPSKGGRSSLQMATCMLMSPDTPLEGFLNDAYYTLRGICEAITIYADEQDVALAIGEFFNRSKGLSRYPFALVAPEPREAPTKADGDDEEVGVLPPMAFERPKQEETALDVDVINTSFLDDNVPQLRHINLPANVHVVDDLREIIATRQRANQRRRTSRMIRLGRAANVYSFMAAPGHISTDMPT